MKIILLADDRILTATSEMRFKAEIRLFCLIMSEYNLKVSVSTNITELYLNAHERCKITINYVLVGQIWHSNYVGYDAKYY
jgi:hypothetical protein